MLALIHPCICFVKIDVANGNIKLKTLEKDIIKICWLNERYINYINHLKPEIC